MSYIANSGRCAIDFSVAGGNVAGRRMQAKYCELCTRMYFREASADPRGECDRCIARVRLRQAQEAHELAAARQPYDRSAPRLCDATKMMPQ
jgi:hypothetical protein